MVDTIRNDSPSVVASTGHAQASKASGPPTACSATTSEMRMPAAPGMGSPTMYLPGFCGLPLSPMVRTLNRARRMAPHDVKRNAVNSASIGWYGEAHR